MTAQHLYYLFQCFFIYAFLGWCTEVAFAAFKERRFVNRGFLNGPICPVYGFGVVAVIHFLTPLRSNLLLLYLGSAILVTAIEWLTGFILEKVFHNKWWDYSNMPLNLNGYVCLLFSLIWGVFCVFIVDVFHPLIDTLLSHIPFLVGIILVCILVIAGLADLYVTASGILKLNKRLEKMQAIADELHQISDKLGESIYKRTITAMEKQEEFKDTVSEKQEEFKSAISEKQEAISDTLADVSDEVKERIALLRRSYLENVKATSHMQKRIMKAFPKMQSRNYKESFEHSRRIPRKARLRQPALCRIQARGHRPPPPAYRNAIGGRDGAENRRQLHPSPQQEHYPRIGTEIRTAHRRTQAADADRTAPCGGCGGGRCEEADRERAERHIGQIPFPDARRVPRPARPLQCNRRGVSRGGARPGIRRVRVFRA